MLNDSDVISGTFRVVWKVGQIRLVCPVTFQILFGLPLPGLSVRKLLAG